MKNTRRVLFRIGALVVLLAIAGAMMVIGRGHTVYFDNKSIDYNGQTYSAFYKAVVHVNGEQVAKLYNKERGMATWVGQNFEMTLEITKEKGGSEETVNVSLPLPYSMDGIAINLPAYLAGLPEEAYLSQFVPLVKEESEAPTDPITTDEPILGDI